jgi:hypothetical protein
MSAGASLERELALLAQRLPNHGSYDVMEFISEPFVKLLPEVLAGQCGRCPRFQAIRRPHLRPSQIRHIGRTR